jgi:hypothetical protein
MFFASAWFGEVAVVVLYVCVRGAVAELAGDGWPARGGVGRLFFDDTLVFVTIVMSCHCSDGMTCLGVLLYSLEFVSAGMRLAWG